jgi:Tol biopolymer transport system component
LATPNRRRALIASALALIALGSVAAPSAATFPGTNGPILFRTDNFNTGLTGPLMRANPDGSEVTVINRRVAFFADWRADGKRIAIDIVEPDFDSQIATLNPDGGGLHVITSGRGIHDTPSWSPNGQRLVFNYSPLRPDNPDFETRLWTIRANGTQMRRLPIRNPGFDAEPRFSPDGTWITFGRTRITPDGRRQAIFVVKAKGGHAARLTPWKQFSEHPTWSPDGQWIIFNTRNGFIQVVRPNGEDRHVILPAAKGSGGHKPWYSPDGSRILFMCENQGTLPRPPADYNQDICVMNADGTNVVRIVSTPKAQENYPSWGPAPTG